ncbi:MAG TPA: hypothetical protein VJX91_07670 [Candidatus Eisenbacteria bacterium]|nr:hypothetical protein [Candidatus Eisenbacteria bacterium]
MGSGMNIVNVFAGIMNGVLVVAIVAFFVWTLWLVFGRKRGGDQ